MTVAEIIEAGVALVVEAESQACHCDGGQSADDQAIERREVDGVPCMVVPFGPCKRCGGTGTVGPDAERRLALHVAGAVGFMLQARADGNFPLVMAALDYCEATFARFAAETDFDPAQQRAQLLEQLQQRADELGEQGPPLKGQLTPEEIAELGLDG